MVKTVAQNHAGAGGPGTTPRRRGGVNNTLKRAAAAKRIAGGVAYTPYGNKSLNRTVGGGAAAATAAGGQTAHGGDKATSSVYSRKWLEENDREKQPFADEVLASTFGPENLEKLVTACKEATQKEVDESNRLLSDDYVYSVQITSHRTPHVPMHLSRM